MVLHPVRKAALVVCIVLPVLAIAAVCLRFYARKARRLPLLADDWSVLFALVGEPHPSTAARSLIASSSLLSSPVYSLSMPFLPKASVLGRRSYRLRKQYRRTKYVKTSVHFIELQWVLTQDSIRSSMVSCFSYTSRSGLSKSPLSSSMSDSFPVRAFDSCAML